MKKIIFASILAALSLSYCTTPEEKANGKTYMLWESSGNFKSLLTVNYSWLGAVVTVGSNYSTGTATNSIRYKIDSKDDNTIKLTPEYNSMPLLFGEWTIGGGSAYGGGFMYIEIAEDGQSITFSDESGTGKTLYLEGTPGATQGGGGGQTSSTSPRQEVKPDTLFTVGDYEKKDYSGVEWKELCDLTNNKSQEINSMIQELKDMKLADDETTTLPCTLLVKYNEYFCLLEEMIKRPKLNEKATENNLLSTISGYVTFRKNQNIGIENLKKTSRERGQKTEFIQYPELNIDALVERLQNMFPKYRGKTNEEIAQIVK